MPEPLYAIVEIMGHRQRAGAISDTTLGGATLLRIEHPTRQNATDDGPLVEYYSPQAIFAIRPCSRAEAEATCRWAWGEPVEAQALNPAYAELVDDDDLTDPFAEAVLDDDATGPF